MKKKISTLLRRWADMLAPAGPCPCIVPPRQPIQIETVKPERFRVQLEVPQRWSEQWTRDEAFAAVGLYMSDAVANGPLRHLVEFESVRGKTYVSLEIYIKPRA